jgi:tetratricopeptide (TPR) repeat protein
MASKFIVITVELIAVSCLALPASAPAADARTEPFARKVDEYRKRFATASPEDAAKEWIALAEEALKAPKPKADPDGAPPNPSRRWEQLFASLPPPPAWDALAKLIDARPQRPGRDGIRDLALRLLGHTLIGDEKAQQADLAALDAMVKTAATTADRADADYLATLLPAGGDSPDVAVAEFERTLSKGDWTGDELAVPDLVTLIGRDRAVLLLKRALTASRDPLDFYQADPTENLARELALKHAAELKSPQWQLVDVCTPALFEAMTLRFPRPTTRQSGGLFAGLFGAGGNAGERERDWRRDAAEEQYLLGLMAAGRTDDAKRLLLRVMARNPKTTPLPSGFVEQLAEANREPAAYDALHAILADNPNLPLWFAYRALGSRTGRTEEVIASARAALKRDDLTPARQWRVKRQLHHALLAAGRVDDAVAVLRELLGSRAALDELAKKGDGGGGDEGFTSTTHTGWARHLLELGLLLDNAEWRDEGVRLLEAEYAGDDLKNETYGYTFYDVVATLSDAGRGPQAARLLGRLIERQHLAPPEADADDMEYAPAEDVSRRALIELMVLYHRAGRHDEVVALLNTAPLWGAKDLIDFYLETDHRDVPVGYFAADALLHLGKRDAALKIIEPVLEFRGGYDAAYELRVRAAGADDVDKTIARFDELARLDPFEERPLIWKAVVLQRAGKLEEAERVARQALAIDPLDGKEDTCDASGSLRDAGRARGYAALADILEARGDARQAATYRRRVEAVHARTQAERLYDAGLLARAVEALERAAANAPDAYDVQFRLAALLAEAGKSKEAEAYYRKAYALMPASFGRTESQCFDCDDVFPTARHRRMAEQAFAPLLDAQPANPRVRYLLAFIHQEDGRLHDALLLYREAVRLDPDYLSAWQQIESLAGRLRLPSREHDEASFNVLRLDPMYRQSTPDLAAVRDLRGLWTAMEAALRVTSEPPDAMYPLAASAAELKEDDNENDVAEADAATGYAYDDDDEAEGRPATPGEAVARTDVIAAIRDVISDDDD